MNSYDKPHMDHLFLNRNGTIVEASIVRGKLPAGSLFSEPEEEPTVSEIVLGDTVHPAVPGRLATSIRGGYYLTITHSGSGSLLALYDKQHKRVGGCNLAERIFSMRVTPNGTMVVAKIATCQSYVVNLGTGEVFYTAEKILCVTDEAFVTRSSSTVLRLHPDVPLPKRATEAESVFSVGERIVFATHKAWSTMLNVYYPRTRTWQPMKRINGRYTQSGRERGDLIWLSARTGYAFYDIVKRECVSKQPPIGEGSPYHPKGHILHNDGKPLERRFPLKEDARLLLEGLLVKDLQLLVGRYLVT